MSDPTQPPPPEGDPYAPPPSGETPAPVPPPPPAYTPPPPPAPPAYTPPPAAPPAYGTPPPAYGTPPPGYGAPVPPAYSAPAYGGAPAATMANNMGLAITALIVGLCCSGIFGLVTGILAVVFASQVNGKAAVGDVAGAAESARKARLFSLITFGIVVVSLVIGAILVATGAINTSVNTSVG